MIGRNLWFFVVLAVAAPAHADQAQIARALVILRPTAQYVLRGDDCTGLQWLDQLQTAPTCAEISAAIANPPPVVPQTVSAMQAKVALSRAGLLASVQVWINSQSAETQLIWNSSASFDRSSALISAAATALGLTAAQVDRLFIQAGAITP